MDYYQSNAHFKHQRLYDRLELEVRLSEVNYDIDEDDEQKSLGA